MTSAFQRLVVVLCVVNLETFPCFRRFFDCLKVLWIVREHQRGSDKLGPAGPDRGRDGDPPGVREPPPHTETAGRVTYQRLPHRHPHLCT